MAQNAVSYEISNIYLSKFLIKARILQNCTNPIFYLNLINLIKSGAYVPVIIKLAERF